MVRISSTQGTIPASTIASEGAAAKVLEIEHRLGALPLLARVWYETLASVDFRQADPQLRLLTATPAIRGRAGAVPAISGHRENGR